MSNDIKDQQVLNAIMNVQKYTENLKKNACNRKQDNDDTHSQDIISTQYLLEHRSKYYIYQDSQFSEIASHSIITKSQYRQCGPLPHPNHKKQTAITFLPNYKKNDRNNNQQLILSLVPSPEKKSNSKMSLSLSSEFEVGKSVGNKNDGRKDNRNDKGLGGRTGLRKMKKSRRQSTPKNDQKMVKTSSVLDQNQPKQSNTVVCLLQSPKQTSLNNNKLVPSLLTQISNLKHEITNYKKILLVLRTRYLQMEEKCKKKIQMDHLLDVLKIEIKILQNKNKQLSRIIYKQNQKIIGFQARIVQMADKLMNEYRYEKQKIIRLENQNQVYKQLIFLKTPILKQLPKLSVSVIKNIQMDNNCEGGSNQSESEDSCEEIINCRTLCRNENDIRNKYNEKLDHCQNGYQ